MPLRHRSLRIAIRCGAAPALFSLVLPLAAAQAQESGGAPPAPPRVAPGAPQADCMRDSAYRVLDFWLGDWAVYARPAPGAPEQQVGTNRVERVLRGCAVLEHWVDASGSRGESLFYYHPTVRRWKQVWVTEQSARPGGLKEKQLVAVLPGGGTRFQGELVLPDGRVVLDRTTLTPLPDGAVRQLIEVSRDGGTTWEATFDARYVRRSGPTNSR